MKKILIALVLSAFLAACSKNDHSGENNADTTSIMQDSSATSISTDSAATSDDTTLTTKEKLKKLDNKLEGEENIEGK